MRAPVQVRGVLAKGYEPLVRMMCSTCCGAVRAPGANADGTTGSRRCPPPCACRRHRTAFIGSLGWTPTTADALLAAAQEARVCDAKPRRPRHALDRMESQLPGDARGAGLEPRAGAPEQADRLATALVPFWIATKRIDEGEAGSSARSRSPGRTRAAPAPSTTTATSPSSRALRAGRRAVRRCAAARGAGRGSDLGALALAGSARVALNTDPGEAVRLLREAIEVTADLPDSDGRSSANHVLGVALQMAGDLEGARDVMSERLERARMAGNDFVVAVESANLSMVERKLGNLDAAEALSLEALRIVSRRGDEMAIPWVINGLAAVTAARAASNGPRRSSASPSRSSSGPAASGRPTSASSTTGRWRRRRRLSPEAIERARRGRGDVARRRRGIRAERGRVGLDSAP